MVDYTQTKTKSGSGIGFIFAAVIVVLILLYALFAGGGVETTTDPAALGADSTAPVVDDTAPAAPATQ